MSKMTAPLSPSSSKKRHVTSGGGLPQLPLLFWVLMATVAVVYHFSGGMERQHFPPQVQGQIAIQAVCVDFSILCFAWVSLGYCNSTMVLPAARVRTVITCPVSCGVCGGTTSTTNSTSSNSTGLLLSFSLFEKGRLLKF
jgi:hypothetical protein